MFDEAHAGERMEREDGRPRQAIRGGGVGLPEAGQLAPAIVRQVVGPAGLLEKFQYTSVVLPRSQERIGEVPWPT